MKVRMSCDGRMRIDNVQEKHVVMDGGVSAKSSFIDATIGVIKTFFQSGPSMLVVQLVLSNILLTLWELISS